MTKKLISFPSIEQYRNVVANINRHYNFIGVDENGEAIYDINKVKPILKFKGTIKLHGTNASICLNKKDGLWIQSRENIITPLSDNAGFANFVEANKSSFEDLMSEVIEHNNLDKEFTSNKISISIYGEWAGGNIQKGVGISNLPKSFFIFGVKISPIVNTEEEAKSNPAYWVDSFYLKNPEKRIYNIEDYKTYEIEIDFNNPSLAQNKIIDMTLEVENECPVAKSFGFDGIGEGIVFTSKHDGIVYRFKSKGLKHAGKSKVKVLREVDDDKVKKARETADKVTPAWRLQQMIDKACNRLNGGEIDRSKLGLYLKMVNEDIIKEDLDIINEAGLEPKDINKYVNEIAKNYFFNEEKI